MRRLLIVAPAFPPHPSPATHRARFLSTYAPLHGWEPEVLTVAPRHYEDALDEELERLVPVQLRVTRVSALSARWTRRLGVGDLGLRSYLAIRRALMRICEERRPSLIYFPGWPFFAFRLGATARRRFGIPYVLDYTDPWIAAGRPAPALSKTGLAQRLGLLFEPEAVRHASRILAVSDGTHDALRERYPDVRPDRYRSAPFGVELADFATLGADRPGTELWDGADARVHVSYVGAVSHTMEPVARAILAALARLLAERPTLRDRLRVHFVGSSYDPFASSGPIAPMAAELGLGDVVDERPRRVGYGSALRGMLASDVQLAIGSIDAHYTPSKIYNCVAAGRPLLAVMNSRSSAVDAARDLSVEELVTFDEPASLPSLVPEIAAALSRLIERPRGVRRRVSPSAFGPFTAAETSASIFAILDDVLREESAVGEPRDRQGLVGV